MSEGSQTSLVSPNLGPKYASQFKTLLRKSFVVQLPTDAGVLVCHALVVRQGCKWANEIAIGLAEKSRNTKGLKSCGIVATVKSDAFCSFGVVPSYRLVIWTIDSCLNVAASMLLLRMTVL